MKKMMGVIVRPKAVAIQKNYNEFSCGIRNTKKIKEQEVSLF